MKTTTGVAQKVEATSKIFKEYGKAIRNTIRFHVNDESIVDDIFHDFFLSLVRRPVCSDIQNLKGYLCNAVKNDIIDAVRRCRSYDTRNQKYADLHMNHVRYALPEDTVIRTEEIDNLFNVIEEQLRPHEATAITQRYRYGRDIGEGACAMQINKRTFSRYICTGLKKIRGIVGQV